MTARAAAGRGKESPSPPRARILAAAGDLFYRHGIRAVGVEEGLIVFARFRLCTRLISLCVVVPVCHA